MAGDGTVVAQLAAAFEHAVWGAATLKEAAAAVANVAGAAGVELAARPLVICELYRDCGPAAASAALQAAYEAGAIPHSVAFSSTLPVLLRQACTLAELTETLANEAIQGATATKPNALTAPTLPPRVPLLEHLFDKLPTAERIRCVQVTADLAAQCPIRFVQQVCAAWSAMAAVYSTSVADDAELHAAVPAETERALFARHWNELILCTDPAVAALYAAAAAAWGRGLLGTLD